jgi:hypothetical protein
MDLAQEKLEYGEALDAYIRQFIPDPTDIAISPDVIVPMDDGSDLFAFNQNAIFNEVINRSLYTSQTVSDENGMDGMDKIALSESSDKDMFYPLLRNSVYTIYRKLCAIGRNIEGAVKYNEDVESYSGKYIAYNVKFSDSFEENMKGVVLQGIHDALMAGILSQWYALRRMYQEANVQKEQFEEALRQIKRDLMYRKKPIRRKSQPF